MTSFTSCSSELPDSWDFNARHLLNKMLFMALCAVLCGGGLRIGGSVLGVDGKIMWRSVKLNSTKGMRHPS